MSRRVVVTGIGMLTPFGRGSEATLKAIRSGATAVRSYPEWSKYKGLRTRYGAQIPVEAVPDTLPLRHSRSMGRVAQLAFYSAEIALENAKIEKSSSLLTDGRCGIAFGSGIGSIAAFCDYTKFLSEGSTQGLMATTYHRIMSHTCASNIGIGFGITGRIIPTSSACTSGSQGIGFACESIRSGAQEIMIAGGAEEFAPAIAAMFDVLCACSTSAEGIPTPRPFDKTRDGIVLVEGACSLILESYEHAAARGAPMLAEVVGFGTNSDGWHITNPKAETMARCVEIALRDARLSPTNIQYVNAHATGTFLGDKAEALAMREVFKNHPVPISTVKGHLGHTLGACGAIEAALTIEMMRARWISPTRNLEKPLEEGADLNLLKTPVEELEIEFGMSNTFAFGGVNTSLIFKAM